MNKVVFDLLFAQPQGETKFHGGGEYIKSVFAALAKGYLEQCELEVCFNRQAFLDDWILKVIEKQKIKVHNVTCAEDVVELLKKVPQNQNCHFFTGMIYGYGHLNLPNHIRKIGVCHGLRGIEKPYDREAWRYISTKRDIKEWFLNTIFEKTSRERLKYWFTNLLMQFDVVVTDSEHSAYSIKLNLNKLSANLNLKVFYTPQKFDQQIAFYNGNKTNSYILMISSNRWLKNSYRGVQAIDQLYQQGFLEGIRTHIYGNLPNQIKKTLKCPANFDFYGYVSSEELEDAYRNCDVFFYPTLNEGFGLPPMEAMKYGKTCVISGVCSLPELYGDAVYYCNPYDTMEMQNRLLHAVEVKIPISVIQNKIEKIIQKQKDDLNILCELIIQ